MTYDVQVLKMGECRVPGPEVYWMSNWDTRETLHFWMVVIRGREKHHYQYRPSARPLRS